MSQELSIETSFNIKDDWSHGGGFTGEISFTNNGDDFKDWTLEFDADFEISKIWNAEIVSHVGERYVIKNGRWNNQVDAGETTKFGFTALVDNHMITKPNNYVFNQQQLGVSPLKNESLPTGNRDNNFSIDTLFKVKNNWSHGGGFTGEISFTNNGDDFKDWTLEFDADFEISKIWNAEIVSHVGERYVIKNGRWNNQVDAGETTKFGFNALVDNHMITEPNNYVFNQQQLDISVPEEDDAPSPKPSSSPKPNSSPSSTISSNISSKAIVVGFENHNAGAKYDVSKQSKDWDVDWSESNWMKNYATITDSSAHSEKNDDREDDSGGKALRITYLPDKRTGGSAAWKLPAQKQYYLSYWVKFDNNFDFDGSKRSGGKLPGLGGAGGLCSGGQPCTGNNGFTARYMWGKKGQAKLYLYHMNKPTKWGENFWFKDSDGQDVYFEQGKWHNLIQRVKLNHGSKSDGEIDVWMDGEQVLSLDGMKFVTNNKGIDTLMFNTFHGGNGSEWLPDHKQHSYFDDFVISTNASDVGL